MKDGSLPDVVSAGGARAGPLRFGRYILVEPLGVGGMAEVFRALVVGPEQFQRTVVVKRILPQLGANPAFVKMFIDEATLCGRLSHPNVIQVHEFGRCEDQYFIAMEYVHGRALNHVLTRLVERRERMPATLAAEIARQACRGLSYAHALKSPEGKPLGIIHRDITPGNVMVAFSGAVKILDFGVARVESRFRRGATDPGHLKGKTGYFAPEQFSSETTDHRADIFSTGIILHELLTRKRLFKAPSATEAIKLIKSAPIVAPSRLNPDVPPALDAIVLRALERDRDRRYPNAGEMADALESFLLEQRFSSQELPRFIRALFEEEPTNDRIRLSPEELESLFANRPIDTATAQGEIAVPGAAASRAVVPGGPGQAVARNPSGTSQSVPPSSVLAEWPELGEEPPVRPRRRLLVVSAAIAAAAVAIFLVVARGRPGRGPEGVASDAPGSPAPVAAGPGARPQPAPAPPTERAKPAAAPRAASAQVPGSGAGVRDTMPAAAATQAPAAPRPEPDSPDRQPRAIAGDAPTASGSARSPSARSEPESTRNVPPRRPRPEGTSSTKQTQRIRHALPIDPFAP